MPASNSETVYLRLLDLWLDHSRKVTRAACAGALRLAPDSLLQSINPGWSLLHIIVNNGNSGDPALEQRIVEQASYGRQIGRIMAAVEVLVARIDPASLTTEEKAAFAAFQEIVALVCEVKQEAVTARPADAGIQDLRRNIEELTATLRALRQADPALHAQLRASLQQALQA
jgi:hypothetical protein